MARSIREAEKKNIAVENIAIKNISLEEISSDSASDEDEYTINLNRMEEESEFNTESEIESQ